MRVCIFGAGAIGGYLGARLALGGTDVSLVARGPHMAAIRSQGLTLLSGGNEQRCPVACTDEAASLGPQDVVIVTLKAHAVPAVTAEIASLFGPATAVVMAVNGIPWWYFYRLAGPFEDRRIRAVDPDGLQWARLGPQRVIGCVVYPACEVVAPGVVRHIEGDRVTLGEPSGETTARVSALARVLRAAGLKAPIKARIRDEIWLKLWGNLSFNPLSALTGATLATLCRTPGTRAVARAMMVEAQGIAETLGVRFPLDVDRRIAGAEAVGPHKTSMLQDLERGRPMEIDALVSAVQELGHLVGVETPAIDTVLALVKLRAHGAGCYPVA